MPSHHGYHEMKELSLKGDEAEHAPIIKSCEYYDTIESIGEEGRSGEEQEEEDSSVDEDNDVITKKMLSELCTCTFAFIGRGLIFNSLGPTLIDLRQIASLSIADGGWLYVSQSIGFFISCLVAKVFYQEFSDQIVIAACSLLKAVFTVLIPALGNAYFMCAMFIGQGFMEGLAGVGTFAICIRLGGKKWNGVFLQTICFGYSIGSICGPFIARPFLSELASHNRSHPSLWHAHLINATLNSKTQNNNFEVKPQMNITLNSTFDPVNSSLPNSALLRAEAIEFTKTHVYIYYIILSIISFIPCILFGIHHRLNGQSIRKIKTNTHHLKSLTLRDFTAHIFIALGLIFIFSLLQFGTQQAYSNLLTTFAVLGPLHFNETQGVYISSVFWTSMCVGRLIGIWVAKFLSPFKMLIIDMIIGSASGAALVVFGEKSSEALWIFTAVLGLAYSTTTGSIFSWAANHLPNDTYIIVILTIGDCLGVIIAPTIVTSLFSSTGPMILMYSVFASFCVMMITIVLAHLTASRYGVDKRLLSKSEEREGEN